MSAEHIKDQDKRAVQANAKKIKMWKVPSFDSVTAEREHKLERLAGAFRIFAKYGYEEGVAGHLTVRDPEKRDHFWVNPFALPFAMITKSHLLCINDAGEVVAGGLPGYKIYNTAAFAIHHQIHKARPDANAACHSHSLYGKAFSTLGINLEITNQDACALYNDVAVYPSFGGVVVAEEEGQNIAKYLGKKKAVILQNHGILSVGETIDSAVAVFHTLERACETQLKALAALKPGEKLIPIDKEEAEFSYERIGTERFQWMQAQPLYAVLDRESGGEYKK